MKLGRISYLNTTPYFHFLSKRWLDRHAIVHDNPRRLGELAREGRLDAAPFSLADAEELVAGHGFEFLPGLGIAGSGPIQSILLFGVEDPASLEGQAVAVTPHTSTTTRLMQVWLSEKVGIRKLKLVHVGEPASAMLLIGDPALARLRRPLPGDPTPIDLSEEWTRWTGLPFIFARWAVRSSLPENEKRELLYSLKAAVDLALGDLEHLAESETETTGFPEDFIIQYLGKVRFHLGEEELRGAALFLEKWAAFKGFEAP